MTEVGERIEDARVQEVHLRNIVVAHFHATSQYHDELMRELRLIQASPTNDARLNELAELLVSEFFDFVPAIREAVERAELAGRTELDLTVFIAPETRRWLMRFRDHFREIDAFCEMGRLLALGSPGVAVVFREWILGELISQLEGGPPHAYQ